MHMENKISFTGIRNLSTVYLSRSGCKKCNNLSMMLCDDLKGQDWTEFTDLIKRIDPERRMSFVNLDNPDVVNIEYVENYSGERCICLNGSPLNCDKDLSLFSYIAKLTRRISVMSDKDMKIFSYYKNFGAKDKLISGIIIDNYENIVKAGRMEAVFNKDNIRNAAAKLNALIQDIMNQYLGIK